MRGKWVMAIGAILALVVVGGIGGLTMKAFAGTSRVKVVDTKVVTKLCVYVDRTDGGDSYGDLSVVPKYSHKICIAGKRGPAGNSSVITWNKTVAQATPPPGTKRFSSKGNDEASVDLAKIGPFTIRGYCFTDEGVEAATDVISGQDGSSFAWGDDYEPGDFNSGDDQQASNNAEGASGDPDWANEYNAGDFAVSTADQTTAFTGSANNGVYIDGPDGPACSFTGYAVLEK